jgi:hypothetical protein
LVPSQLVFLAALLVACDALSGHGLFVPKYQAMDQQPTAIMTGVLVVDDGCIWIESPESGRWLALWPTTISVSTGDPVRVNRYGVEVSEGEPITIGGGAYEEPQHVAFVEDLIGQSIPTECLEKYWLVTELLPEPLPE